MDQNSLLYDCYSRKDKGAWFKSTGDDAPCKEFIPDFIIMAITRQFGHVNNPITLKEHFIDKKQLRLANDARRAALPRMAMMKFERSFFVKDGTPGAFFRGGAYGEKPNRRIFLDFDMIKASLEKFPGTAKKPLGLFHTERLDGDGLPLREFGFLTEEFLRARKKIPEAICRRFDRAARERFPPFGMIAGADRIDARDGTFVTSNIVYAVPGQSLEITI